MVTMTPIRQSQIVTSGAMPVTVTALPGVYHGLVFTTTVITLSKPQNISNCLQIHGLRGYNYLGHSSDIYLIFC